MKIKKTPSLSFKNFSAGNDAIDLSGSPLSEGRDRDWVFTETHDQLILSAFYALGVPHDTNIFCTIALPYGWADSVGPALCRRITGRHNLHGGSREYAWNLKAVYKKQGSLALLSHAYMPGVGIDHAVLESGVVIDPGSYTTEIIPFIKGKANNKAHSAKDLGMKLVADKVQAWLLKERNIIVDTPEAMRIIHERSLTRKGRQVEGVSQQIDLYLKMLAARVYERGKNTLDIDSCNLIFMTGGTGAAIVECFKQLEPRVVTSKTPILDNAKGAAVNSLRAPSGWEAVGLDVGSGYVKAVWMGEATTRAVIFPSVIGDALTGGAL